MTERIPLMPLPDVYDAAAARVARYGLHKGAFKNYERSPGKDYGDCALCALGALLVTAYGTIDSSLGWSTLTNPVIDYLRNTKRLPFFTVQDWSDNSRTTAEEVAETFREVGAKLRRAA